MAAENPTIRALKKRLKPCITALKSILGEEVLFFERQPIAKHGHEVFYLSSKNISWADAKYSYVVLPLFPSPTSIFWIGLTVEFAVRSQVWRPYQISILVFDGELTDSQKKPILRAEWDSFHQEAANLHAQPHWHVYTQQARLELSFEELIDQSQPDDAVKEFGEVEATVETEQVSSITFSYEPTTRMHFAMASSWHNNSADRGQVELDDDKMTKWIPACVNYIAEQLAYAYLNTGIQDALTGLHPDAPSGTRRLSTR